MNLSCVLLNSPKYNVLEDYRRIRRYSGIEGFTSAPEYVQHHLWFGRVGIHALLHHII